MNEKLKPVAVRPEVMSALMSMSIAEIVELILKRFPSQESPPGEGNPAKPPNRPASASKLMTIQDIADELQISHSHARQRIVTERRFPKPVLIPGRGPRPMARWVRSEVEDHLHTMQRNK